MSNDTALVPYDLERSVSIVSPLVDPKTAKVAIQQYEALKAAIIQPKDVYREERRDRDGNIKTVEYLKKSFWRRLATCFGLSLVMVREQREQDEKGALAYSAFYKAVAPNGRTVEADGYCSRSEPGHQSWSEHSIRATAHTRAKNRAISDMVGGGEVSYEEVQGDGEEEETTRRPATTQRSIAPRTVTPEPVAQPTPRQERQPSAESGGANKRPSPEQVKAILALQAELGHDTGLPADLTFQTAGKLIYELNKEKRDVLLNKEQAEAARAKVAQSTQRRVTEQPVEPEDETVTSEGEEAPFNLRTSNVGMGA